MLAEEVAARRNGEGDALEIEYERPYLYPKQFEAMFAPKDFLGQAARYSFIEASTKAGKTHSAICWLFEQAYAGQDGHNYWWVAPVYNQALIAYRRVKRALPRWIYKSNDSDRTITLVNGAVIWFKSGDDPDNLFGEDVYAAVVDEASRVKELAWNAVRSVLTFTRGPVRCIGNVKGRGNWFYRLAHQAKQGKPGLSYHKITAYDAVAAGVLDMAEIEDAKSVLPDHVFRELYLAEPSDDGNNPFGLKNIEAITVDAISSRPSIANGADLAKSRDWTVLLGLDREGWCCGFERWQAPWSITEDRLVDLIGSTPTLIDQTGVGDPIVERLQKRLPHIEGFVFTSRSKQQLMEGLAASIQSHEIRVPGGVITGELEVFEFEYTKSGVRYTAPEGYHDDCVVALALAVEKWRHIRPMYGVLPGSIPRVSPWFGQQEPDDDDHHGA